MKSILVAGAIISLTALGNPAHAGILGGIKKAAKVSLVACTLPVHLAVGAGVGAGLGAWAWVVNMAMTCEE